MSVFGDGSVYDLEFRSTADDAWYSARVVVENDTMTVKLCDFPDSVDEKFNAADFKTPEDVDEFVQRFRQISEQLQDSHCSRLVEGLTVCALFKLKEDDIRFYDAVVEAVHNSKHSFVNEEEECLCTFVLFWQHGPKWGEMTPANIADICLIESSASLDPRVTSFSRMAKEKFEICSRNSSSVSDGGISLSKIGKCDKEKICSTIKPKSSSSQCIIQEESAGQFGSLVGKAEGKVRKICQQDHDRDLGGNYIDMNSIKNPRIHYFILIENIEKDLSPSSIMEFIHKQTSVSPLAYVFPSLSMESYTRGAIVLDCKKELCKINEFLNNPDHIILSSRGRPWVITEKSVKHGTFKMGLGGLMPKSQYEIQNTNIENELRVVHSGTGEFRTAKRLRDLFVEFVDHQHRLHKRLALEEREILQQRLAV
ncbi:unnamed protein product [Ilex paraguariensis]|uniref:SAWADEE domain-containing protein n=1 Tax=Ilex paraguariensis TaxID=185542 RepID=A0ABC8TCQ3_9AQUA